MKPTTSRAAVGLTGARRGPSRATASLLALVLALALVWFAALPAAAQNDSSGTAAGGGNETVFDHANPDEHPNCLPVHEAEYVIDVVGTFTATESNGTSASVGNYDGLAEIKVEASDFYITPDGTHQTSACSGPEPVDATVTVTSPSSGITCGPEPGKLLRENFTYFEVTWEGACDVAGVSTGDVGHIFRGDQQPCGPDPFELLPEGACDPLPLVHGVWQFPHNS